MVTLPERFNGKLISVVPKKSAGNALTYNLVVDVYVGFGEVTLWCDGLTEVLFGSAIDLVSTMTPKKMDVGAGDISLATEEIRTLYDEEVLLHIPAAEVSLKKMTPARSDGDATIRLAISWVPERAVDLAHLAEQLNEHLWFVNGQLESKENTAA